MTKQKVNITRRVYDVSWPGSFIVRRQRLSPYRNELWALQESIASTSREGWSLVGGSKKKGPGFDEWRQEKRYTVGAFSLCTPPMCQRLASQCFHCSPFTPGEEDEVLFTLTSLLWKKEILVFSERNGKNTRMKRKLPCRHWQEKQRFWNPSVYNNKGEKEWSLYCSLRSLLSRSNSHLYWMSYLKKLVVKKSLWNLGNNRNTH